MRDRLDRLDTDRQARAVMEDVLGGPSTRGAPDLAGAAGAPAVAPLLLEVLARIYGVRRWSVLEFQRAFARGALVAWRPGAMVRASPRETRVTSTSCPIGEETEAALDRCARCQSLQLESARVALGPAFRGADFESVLARAAGPHCTLVVRHAAGATEQVRP